MIKLYSAIHVGIHWKIQDRRQIKNIHTTKTKHNPEKQTTQNTKEQNSARKQGGLILQSSRAQTDKQTDMC